MAATLNDCIKTLCTDNSTQYMQPFSSHRPGPCGCSPSSPQHGGLASCCCAPALCLNQFAAKCRCNVNIKPAQDQQPSSHHCPGSMLLQMLLTTAWWSIVMLLCISLVPECKVQALGCASPSELLCNFSHCPWSMLLQMLLTTG